MIRAEQIPDEVAWKLHDKLWKVGGPSVDEVRASIAAALNAWPSMRVDDTYRWLSDVAIILPMEDKNAEA